MDRTASDRLRATPRRGSRRWAPRVGLLGAAVALLSVVAFSGCSSSSAQGGGSGSINVVAAEGFWGSIASQLGGARVSVVSIVTDPNADPHEYASNTNDARAVANARYVILNGAGYDSWAQRLLDGNPVSGRKTLNVARVLGKQAGDNPHFWYDPGYVEQVADRVTADYQALDPADATFFSQRRAAFETALKPYHDRIASIKAAFAGRKIGATETIFDYMASALGLDVISPPAFMQAVSEGNDPPAGSVVAFQQQITQRQITALVYNVQTATAVTTNVKQMATQQGIPVVGVSETLQPPGVSFQDWQYAQLLALQRALDTNAPNT